MPRLFVAAVPNPQTVAALEQATAQFRLELAKRPGTVVPPHQLHVTLRFIGEVPSGRVAQLGQDLAAAAARHRSLTIMVSTVPRLLPSGAVALEVMPNPALTALAAAVSEACGGAGNGGRYRPHVTLGRPRVAPQLPNVAESKLAWPVSSFELIESTLSHSGPTYRTVATYPLAEP